MPATRPTAKRATAKRATPKRLQKPAKGAGAKRDASSVAGERLWQVRAQRIAVFGALALVVIAALAVPASRYMSQRSEIAMRDAELKELTERNDELAARRDRLDDPDEIQQIARRDYGLVLEGEESYTILPSPTAGLVLPRSWPFDVLSAPLEKAASARS